MRKVFVILFLASASSVFAIECSEQFIVEPVMLLQTSSCTELGTTNELQNASINNIELVSAAREFFSPPPSFVQLNDRLPAGITTLPAVPAAIFMGLYGFFCILFVKERRILLIALTGFLWAGQVGINAIPKLVSHIAGRNNRSLPAQLSSPCYLENSSVLLIDRGSRYIGLLRHLAGMPRENFKFQISNYKYDKAQKLLVAWPQDAIIPSQILSSLHGFLVKRTEQFICFTPAFIFDNLARGPPDSP